MLKSASSSAKDTLIFVTYSTETKKYSGVCIYWFLWKTNEIRNNLKVLFSKNNSIPNFSDPLLKDKVECLKEWMNMQVLDSSHKYRF